MDRQSRAQGVGPDGGQTPASDEVFCTECGSIIKEQAEICPECGVRQLPSSSGQTGGSSPTREHAGGGGDGDPALAAVLSFFLPGLGQFYNGDHKKGAALLGGAIFSILLMSILIGFLTYPAIWAYGIYDAYHSAEEQ